MYKKRYSGTGGNKVAASSFFKSRNKLQKLPSNGPKLSTRRAASSVSSKKVPPQPYGQLGFSSPEMYNQYQQSLRFAEPPRHRTMGPQAMAYVGQLGHMSAMMDDEDGPYDELEDLDSLECDRVQRKKKQDENRNRMKMIFAALMLPSLIALFNSHKKMNKGSENNIDIEALKSGGFPGFPGMAGGAMGGGGGGGGFGGGHRHGGIHPDFERDFEQMQQQSHESPSAPGESGDADAKKASPQEYAERLMAQYASKVPPGAGDMDLGDEDEEASETTTAPADSAPDEKDKEEEQNSTDSSGKEKRPKQQDADGSEDAPRDADGGKELQAASGPRNEPRDDENKEGRGENESESSRQAFTETSTESSGESPHDEL